MYSPYNNVHIRLFIIRGKASNYNCVDCNKQAKGWSYDHKDPCGKFDPIVNMWFSSDISHYEPRCLSCHSKYDNGKRLYNEKLLGIETSIEETLEEIYENLFTLDELIYQLESESWFWGEK